MCLSLNLTSPRCSLFPAPAAFTPFYFLYSLHLSLVRTSRSPCAPCFLVPPVYTMAHPDRPNCMHPTCPFPPRPFPASPRLSAASHHFALPHISTPRAHLLPSVSASLRRDPHAAPGACVCRTVLPCHLPPTPAPATPVFLRVSSHPRQSDGRMDVCSPFLRPYRCFWCPSPAYITLPSSLFRRCRSFEPIPPHTRCRVSQGCTPASGSLILHTDMVTSRRGLPHSTAHLPSCRLPPNAET